MTRLRFDDRVAVVTGSGSGLGAAHARLLADRGAQVVVNDLDPDAGAAVVEEITAAGGTALAHPGDVSVEADATRLIEAALEAFGHLDIVVNNAGVLRTSPFAELTAELWDRVMAVNLRGTFLVTRAAWPHFVAQGRGRIVSTTSNSGLLGVSGSSAYATSKAAIWGLTRSLALEGAPLGVNVNAIAPMAYTAMSASSKVAPKAWRSGEGDEWSRRLAPAQVSPVVAWLAHDDCRLTGQVVSAVGGRVARFSLRLGEGFEGDELTVEDVRAHEAELLRDDPGIEYGAAFEEARDLHRRLMPSSRRPET